MQLLTADQVFALAQADRHTRLRIKMANVDGELIELTDLDGEDWFNEGSIDASSDAPISRATLSFWRRIGLQSLAPLLEASSLNTDGTGIYSPLVNPYRYVSIEVATLAHGLAPAEDEWRMLWEGYVDEIEWGGFRSKVVVYARDPISKLNDTYIETQRSYGSDTAPVAIQTVMQQILDDNMGAGTYTLYTSSNPQFGIYAYDLVNVSVLDALKALADLIGWNLHWRYDDVQDDLVLMLWEPDRDRTLVDWTFGPDDYYDVTDIRLGISGVRNKGTIVYTDSNDAQQSVSDSRTDSIATYGSRLIKLDAQRTSIVSDAQATSLLSNMLDDLEQPSVLQQIEAAFFWPIALGDLHTYTANGEHYDTDQTWATFSYKHVLSPTKCRTIISAGGKPSGGVRRWYRRERKDNAPTIGAGELVSVFNVELHARENDILGLAQIGTTTTGISASTTQSQGEQQLTSAVNLVTVVATSSDVVTLPEAAAGATCIVINTGANALQIFPASGASIQGGAVNASITLGASRKLTLTAPNTSQWWADNAVPGNFSVLGSMTVGSSLGAVGNLTGSSNFLLENVQTSITASTTQTQGQSPLPGAFNRIATCANANDVVTLPGAEVGLICVVRNDGAQTLQIYPESGDAIDALATDASTTLAAGSVTRFWATSTSQWYQW